MSRGILGIDLGTSSVKLLLVDGKETVKIREPYGEISCQGWVDAIKKAVTGLDVSKISAISFSSQVGTYIADDDQLISWHTGGGEEQLKKLKESFSQEEFIREISMPHPNLTSYPIPRILYAKERFGDFQRICQPKDYLCRLLTGNLVTDMYSWRGLANLKTAAYSPLFLEYTGICEDMLPALCRPETMAGLSVKNPFGLPENIPVYLGCNDFFASLLGMGINRPGQIFDITGTSEHIGIVTESLFADTRMVSGPYFVHNVCYGVTASSGASMAFGRENFGEVRDLEACLQKNPPIFLPYLSGERAPIWDSGARGMFFGISAGCDREMMAYSVLEGIAFSLWHIYEHLPQATGGSLTVSGGGANSGILNRLKAELFDMPVVVLQESDTSALGAVMIAAVAEGVYESPEKAAEVLCVYEKEYRPTGRLRETLLKRFEIYKKLYPAIKNI